MGRRPKENWEATLTEWGQRFEKVRAERRMSYNDVVATLRTHEGFEKLNRSILYRWEFSNRADKMVHLVGRKEYALQVITQLSTQSPASEFAGHLIDELREREEELQRLQNKVRQLIAATTFHRSQ